ncbi:MAG: hypothetical protein WDN27_02415, partial [Candidatus Saccharibacteria bacterium]
MHVVAPTRYTPKPPKRRRKPYLRILVVLVVLAGAANYLRPLPAATATVSTSLPAASPNLVISWPGQGTGRHRGGRLRPARHERQPDAAGDRLYRQGHHRALRFAKRTVSH